MGMMDVIKAFSKKQSYLGSITVTNIFPKNNNDFNPESLKSMQIMTDDSNVVLKIGSIVNKANQTILKKYNIFKDFFKKEYKLLAKDWKEAIKLQEDKENFKKQFEECEKNLGEYYKNYISKVKTQLEKNNNTNLQKQIDELTIKMQEKQQELDNANQEVDSIKSTCKQSMDEDTKKQQAQSTTILENYAASRKLKTEQRDKLFNGTYHWLAVFRDDAKKAKEAYNCLHNLEKWKEKNFEDAFNLLSSPSKFTGKYKPYNEKINSLKKEYDGLSKQLNQLKKIVNSTDTVESIITDLTSEGKQSKYGNYVDRQNTYFKTRADYICCLEKLIERGKRIKSYCQQINTQNDAFTTALHLEKDEQSQLEAAKTETGLSNFSTLNLLQVLGGIWYYVNDLSKKHETIVNKAKEEKVVLNKKLQKYNKKYGNKTFNPKIKVKS